MTWAQGGILICLVLVSIAAGAMIYDHFTRRDYRRLRELERWREAWAKEAAITQRMYSQDERLALLHGALEEELRLQQVRLQEKTPDRNSAGAKP